MICCIFLPKVNTSYYFNREKKPEAAQAHEVEILMENGETRGGIHEHVPYSVSDLFRIWKNSMKNHHTLKWSVWYAFSMCGYLQVRMALFHWYELFTY